MNELSEDIRIRREEHSRLRLFEAKKPLGKFRNLSTCLSGAQRERQGQDEAGGGRLLQILQNNGKGGTFQTGKFGELYKAPGVVG